MKMFRRFLLLLTCAVIGLAIGFIWRRRLGENGVPAAPATIGAGEDARFSAAPQARELSPAQKLERELSLATGVTRWLYWMEALERMPVSEFPRLARLAGKDEIALRLLALRWLELDPKSLFEMLANASPVDGLPVETLGYILVGEWAKRDAAGLTKALKEAPPFPMRDVWRREAAAEITRSDPEAGLRLFADWNIGNFSPSMRGVRKWAAADPRHAAEFLFATPVGYAGQEAMKTVGEEWGKSDPAAALAFAVEKNSLAGRNLAASVLQGWAGRDLPAAADWLLNADPAVRNRLSGPVVAEWAKSDAASALTWAEENLSGASLTEAAASVLKGAAEKDPTAAARLVSAMSPSSARSEAAVEVARKFFPDSISATEPVKPDALAWLRTLDADAAGRVLDRLTWTWADSDARSMAAFLAATPFEDLPASAYVVCGRVLARQNPIDAMEWANSLPEKHQMEGGSDAFANWCQSQPQSAMEWLNQLRQDDRRRAEFLKTAVTYLAYEPNASERLSALPLTDRDTLRALLQTADIPEEKRVRLLSGLH